MAAAARPRSPGSPRDGERGHGSDGVFDLGLGQRAAAGAGWWTHLLLRGGGAGEQQQCRCVPCSARLVLIVLLVFDPHHWRVDLWFIANLSVKSEQ